MRKNFLIYQIVLGFLVLSFASCINQDFDLDDGKLDTNVTLGDGISVPVGSIEKISIYDELLKVYDSLKVGDDGVLYVEYGGAFPVEFPAFEVPTPDGKIDVPTNITSLPSNGGSIPVALLPLPLIQETQETYKISVPELIEEESLKITPKKVGFQSFKLEPRVKLTGLTFPNAGDAKLVLSVKFSDHYGLEEDEITREVPISALSGNDEEYILDPIEVESYSFVEGESGLTYSVTLEGESSIQFTATSPKFTFILDPGNDKLSLSYLECSLEGEKEFKGEVAGFGDLQGAFSDNDTLVFNNPSLTLGLTTNLGADFKLGLDLSKDAKGTTTSAFLDPNSLLSFTKSTDGSEKTESYDLTPEKLNNFDEIISTPFPENLNYTVKLIFNDTEANLLPSDQLELSADYSFKIPFDFANISLSLNDTITGLFSEDTYDQIFGHVDDVSIVADLDVNIGGGGIELVVEAVVLGSDYKEIPGLVSTTQSNNGNTLSIAIDSKDEVKMKKARHLELAFRLLGGGPIKTSDYIFVSLL